MKTTKELHSRYIDDLTTAEAFKIKDLPNLPVTVRHQPDQCHARTGHILPPEKSSVITHLGRIKQYEKDIKIKLMLFNEARNYDFLP